MFGVLGTSEPFQDAAFGIFWWRKQLQPGDPWSVSHRLPVPSSQHSQVTHRVFLLRFLCLPSNPWGKKSLLFVWLGWGVGSSLENPSAWMGSGPSYQGVFQPLWKLRNSGKELILCLWRIQVGQWSVWQRITQPATKAAGPFNLEL